jgi:hypothetical protein
VILNHFAADGWELVHSVLGTYQGIFAPSNERTPTNLEVVSAEFVLRRPRLT